MSLEEHLPGQPSEYEPHNGRSLRSHPGSGDYCHASESLAPSFIYARIHRLLRTRKIERQARPKQSGSPPRAPSTEHMIAGGVSREIGTRNAAWAGDPVRARDSWKAPTKPSAPYRRLYGGERGKLQLWLAERNGAGHSRTSGNRFSTSLPASAGTAKTHSQIICLGGSIVEPPIANHAIHFPTESVVQTDTVLLQCGQSQWNPTTVPIVIHEGWGLSGIGYTLVSQKSSVI
jgi:hypothetical protein